MYIATYYVCMSELENAYDVFDGMCTHICIMCVRVHV